MTTVAVAGLGDIGSGIAKNLLKNGFKVLGFAPSQHRRDALNAIGGTAVNTCQQLAMAEVVLIAVMNGEQVASVVHHVQQGGFKAGGTLIVISTIHQHEIIDIHNGLQGTGIHMIDSPVSGGKNGAQNGTLTLMAAGEDAVLKKNAPVLEAISSNIFHVGNDIGMGQVVKACLQSLIGITFAGIFESLVLGTKAGICGQTLFDVFTNSGVASPFLENTTRLIMDRKFENSGAHISTMYKDLGITMAMAKENGVPMFTTASAYELFQAGKTVYPEGDNWVIVKLLEHLAQSDAVTWT